MIDENLKNYLENMMYIPREEDFGKPKMEIALKNNIYFPGEIIKGHIYLKSGNYLNKGVIIYTIYGQEKITQNNKYKIECNNSTKIFIITISWIN